MNSKEVYMLFGLRMKFCSIYIQEWYNKELDQLDQPF